MVSPLFVYVKAKVQERYGQPGSLELKIQKIELLELVKENIFSTMKLKLDANAINEELIATKIFEKIRGDEKSLTIQLPYLQVFLDKLYLDITHDEDDDY